MEKQSLWPCKGQMERRERGQVTEADVRRSGEPSSHWFCSDLV